MNNNFEKLADLLRQGNFPDFISGLDDMLGDTHYQPVMADKLKEYLNQLIEKDTKGVTIK